MKTSATVTGTGAQTPGTSTYNLDAFGLGLSSVTTGGSTGSQSYIYDASSQGIARSETIGAQTWTDSWYRMGGINM